MRHVIYHCAATQGSLNKRASTMGQLVDDKLAQKIRIRDVIALFLLTLRRLKAPFGANLVCLLFRKCPTFTN